MATVSNVTPRAELTATGGQTIFAYTFLVLDEADIKVYQNGTLLTNPTHYSVTGVGNEAGGTIVLVTGATLNDSIVIIRDTEISRTTKYTTGGVYRATTVENEESDQYLIMQELQTELNRSLTLDKSSTVDASTITVPDPVANTILGWNSGATNLENKTVSPLGALTTPGTTVVGNVAHWGDTTGTDFDDNGFDILDEDNMASDSETSLATQQSIKKYVDDSTQSIDVALREYVDNSTIPRNLLLNGDFRVAQRGVLFDATTTPANNDDTYLLDRWLLLSDGNDVVDVTQETSTIPTGSYSACRLQIETANKKAGILQILEGLDSAAVIGGTASLSFKARQNSNATVDKLRAAVLSWDSTEDAVTSDVVSAWGAEGVDPTLVANWTYENTPSDLTLTNSYQTFTIEGISVDTASTKNVAVFIWIDNDDGTVDDNVYITDVKLEAKATASVFEAPNYAEELNKCKRYFQIGFDRGIPGVVINNTEKCRFMFYFQPEMRIAPTATLLDDTIRILDESTATFYTASSGTIGVAYNNKNGANLRLDGFTGLTIGRPMVMYNTGNEDALSFDGEM